MRKLAVHFDSHPFVRSHGKLPRGRGSWAFDTDQTGSQVFFSPSMTLAEARKWMTEQVRAMVPADAKCTAVYCAILP